MQLAVKRILVLRHMLFLLAIAYLELWYSVILLPITSCAHTTLHNLRIIFKSWKSFRNVVVSCTSHIRSTRLVYSSLQLLTVILHLHYEAEPTNQQKLPN